MFLALYVGAQSFVAKMRDRFTGQDGAVATEYALLLVLIALAIVVAAIALGLAIANVFNTGASSLGTVGT